MTVAASTRLRTRVLLVAPSLRYLGGQAIQSRRLLEHLGREEWVEARILHVDPVLPRGLRWLQRIKYVRTIVTSAAYVTSLLSNVWRYDVVHAFSASYWSFLLAPVPALLVGRAMGKRVIINYRSGEAADHLTRFGWHARPLLRLAHAIVVPSGYLVEVFAQFGLRAVSIFNFLDFDRLSYHRREVFGPKFLSNRNFEAHYNVACVLEAFARIQDVHSGASLAVVGDGPLRESLEQRARELKLRNVVFHGAVTPDEMREHYSAADIYLNAPTVDNMPNSVIEAFASGLVVVSSDAGGIPHIVRDGENGLLVPIGDATALASAALSLLRNQPLAQRLADAAKADASLLYQWDAVRRHWQHVYEGRGAALADGS